MYRTIQSSGIGTAITICWRSNPSAIYDHRMPDDHLAPSDLPALADRVRAFLADEFRLPSTPREYHDPLPVTVDVARGAVMVDAGAELWCGWGARRCLDIALGAAFPGLVEPWSRMLLVFPAQGMRQIDAYRNGTPR